MNGRAHDYQAYLDSPGWREKREAVRLRALGRCEFCRAAMAHVHHVRYPKRLGDEPVSDLVAVCETCHAKSHGRRLMNLEVIPDARPHQVVAPGNVRGLIAASENGNAYATIGAWADMLQVPGFRRAPFEAMVQMIAIGPSAPGRMPRGLFNGAEVYSWQVIAKALRSTDRKYHAIAEQYMPRWAKEFTAPQWREMCAFVQRIAQIHEWGDDMQSQALAARIRGVPAMAPAPMPTALDRAEAAIAKLAEHAVGQARRVERIEAVVLRGGDDGITAVNALGELGLDPEQVVRGRLNFAQAIGMELQRAGVQSLGKVERRPDGRAFVQMVNLWRRRDLYAAIGVILGRDFSHLLIG